MTQGSVGWLCPKCGAVSSPYQATCNACSKTPVSGSATIGRTVVSGYAGTITLGGYPSFDGIASSGTFYFGSRPYTPPIPTFKEKRADEVIAAWKKDGGWSKLRTLIIDAMTDAVEDECSDEDDDE